MLPICNCISHPLSLAWLESCGVLCHSPGGSDGQEIPVLCSVPEDERGALQFVQVMAVRRLLLLVLATAADPGTVLPFDTDGGAQNGGRNQEDAEQSHLVSQKGEMFAAGRT